ncbi:MAG: restriction endonuclease [Hungatella sp.]|jgi:hypothetical protein|nr:restriction endonuclease [Hungatella sp.]
MKPVLTIKDLIRRAETFCTLMSKENHEKLLGITDGKAVGTYVEHRFQRYLSEHYTVTVGSSARGIDLPGEDIQTDIKVTSITQPQSSCPFKNARQKIYGLGYNLLVFVYDKRDSGDQCCLRFTHCTFIESMRTGDFTLTKRLRELVKDGANKEDVIGFLEDRNVPGDEIIYNELADEILNNPPVQGYLTISNALQWRLQYARVIALDNKVDGIINYEW